MRSSSNETPNPIYKVVVPENIVEKISVATTVGGQIIGDSIHIYVISNLNLFFEETNRFHVVVLFVIASGIIIIVFDV